MEIEPSWFGPIILGFLRNDLDVFAPPRRPFHTVPCTTLVFTLLDAANQLIHQLLTTEVLQHPHSVRSCRHASGLPRGAWVKCGLCYLVDNLAKWIIRPISNHFVPTRAAASLGNPRNQDQIAARKVSAFVMAVKRD